MDDAHAKQYRRRYEIITSKLPVKPKAGEYHIDIPCTVEVQRQLMLAAGFLAVDVLDEDIKPRGSNANHEGKIGRKHIGVIRV